MNRETQYEILSKKHDKYIWNVVNSASFSEEVKNVANLIYTERNLDSPEKQELISNFDDYIKEVRLKLNLGLSKEEAVEYLEQRGIEYEHAVKLVGKENTKKKAASSKLGYYITAIFLMYVVVKYIIKLMV